MAIPPAKRLSLDANALDDPRKFLRRRSSLVVDDIQHALGNIRAASPVAYMRQSRNNRTFSHPEFSLEGFWNIPIMVHNQIHSKVFYK
jgi:hypothetical protein